LLGLKNNKINQNITKLDITTRTSSGFQLKFGVPTQVRDSNGIMTQSVGSNILYHTFTILSSLF